MMLDLAVDNETRLRSVTPADAQQLFALVDENRSHLRSWMAWVDATTCVDDIGGFIKSALDQVAGNHGPVCAVLHRDALVGICGFKPISRQHKSGELGYWLAKSLTGRGIMTLCVKTLVNYAFDEMALNRIEIHAATANRRSCAIAERLGFSHEGILRDAEWVNDRFVDMAVYSVLRREWNSEQSAGDDAEDRAPQL